MKETIVKVFSLLLAVTMLAVPVFAGGNQPNLPEEELSATAVQPRAELCSNCGNGYVYYDRTDYGEWYVIGVATNCIHGSLTENDLIKERTVTKVYTCTNCTIEQTFVSYETKQVHP